MYPSTDSPAGPSIHPSIHSTGYPFIYFLFSVPELHILQNSRHEKTCRRTTSHKRHEQNGSSQSHLKHDTQCNIVACSRNQCCEVKTIRIKYYVCVCVCLLVIRRANDVFCAPYYIAICGLSAGVIFLYIISQMARFSENTCCS